jgi:Zn-dependent membrane protease YugP
MHYLILILLVLAIIYLPQIWVRRVIDRYHKQDEDNFSGTGGELARHLLDRFELPHIKVETTDLGDHYDPATQTVRLTPDKFNGKTLTSITVATHECGHALQHAAKEPLFILRSRLAYFTVWAGRIGSFLLFAAPFLVLLTRVPSVAVFNISGAFLIMGFALLVQLITLPVELDASFNKALPLLESGYLRADQMPAARKILRAAALTYVAASLAGLLNFWRWLALLRR